ncbi:hypothetical protein EYF80_053992 [Liparis tanakae]|uniref:Uncharacterized protein n=1 Tax=Liparis tanakae TaxID=230148 RepID=A0A4Z2F525_9TELE|nr:hypothetical protein EYF80_053992 [Liparis tanakae]
MDTPEPMFTSRYGKMSGWVVWKRNSESACLAYTKASWGMFLSTKLQPLMRQFPHAESRSSDSPEPQFPLDELFELVRPSARGFDDFGVVVDQVVPDEVQACFDVGIFKLDEVQPCGDLFLHGYFVELVTGSHFGHLVLDCRVVGELSERSPCARQTDKNPVSHRHNIEKQ